MILAAKARRFITILIPIIVFCGSFYLFYKRAQEGLRRRDLILTSAVVNRPLPKAHLVNLYGESLNDERLRHGKVMLVFMMPDCPPCDLENEFLKTVINSRQDIEFFYIIPFGGKDQMLRLAQNKYALEPFYDVGSNLSRDLEIYQVPIKIFVENGIIKKVWLNATIDQRKQTEFKDWLRSV